jgi:hypothetical protein
LHRQQDQCVVPTPRPGSLIRRGEQGVDLLSTQERYERALEALCRDGQYALDLSGMRRRLEGDVAKERVDRGQAQVARSGRHGTSILQVIEEGNHQRGVDVVQRERRRRLVKPLLDELHQEPERVAV